jgi:hypothetical protein
MAFQPGQSGNPDGRPRGIKDSRTALRELLTPHATDLVAKCVELALSGDTTALRLCLDRLIPPAKAKDDLIRLPLADGSLADKGQIVLSALGDGQLAPDVAMAILQAVGSQARIVEVNDLEQRIAALEARRNG